MFKFRPLILIFKIDFIVILLSRVCLYNLWGSSSSPFRQRNRICQQREHWSESTIWPELKTVHENPRHLQSQCLNLFLTQSCSSLQTKFQAIIFPSAQHTSINRARIRICEMHLQKNHTQQIAACVKNQILCNSK